MNYGRVIHISKISYYLINLVCSEPRGIKVGICGLFGTDDRILLKQMCNAIKHKGDSESLFIDDQIGLGVCDPVGRIACNEDKSVWIAYEGEIYNNSALKDSLEKIGHNFCTSSEAETIVHLYENCDRRCCEHLRGSFTFAIYDARKKKLLLARDRFGDKLLYYTHTDDCFLFSSKIKGLLKYKEKPREIDLHAMNTFFAYFFVPAPHTLFSGIKKMLPAHTLDVGRRQSSLHSYWDLDFSNINTNLNRDNWCDLIVRKLSDSVRIRLKRNGFSLGISLSGGLDSTTVLALMRRLTSEPIKSFSVGYENWKYNELKFASMVSDVYETEHFERIISVEDVRKALPKLAEASEQPIGGYVAIPTYFVYELASKYSKNVFTGDGADLSFWGFPWVLGVKYESLISSFPRWIKKTVYMFMRAVPISLETEYHHELKRLVRRSLLSAESRFCEYMTHFDKEDREKLYAETQKKKSILDTNRSLRMYYQYKKCNSDIEAKYYTLVKTWLPDYWDWDKDLPLDTPISIITPLHDHQLMELAQTIPSYLKQPKRNVTKFVFKRAVMKYKLAPKFVVKRKKIGIQRIPIVRWLNGGLRDMCQEILLCSDFGIEKYLDKTYLSKISKTPVRTTTAAHRIWALLCFIMWYERFMKDEKTMFS